MKFRACQTALTVVTVAYCLTSLTLIAIIQQQLRIKENLTNTSVYHSSIRWAIISSYPIRLQENHGFACSLVNALGSTIVHSDSIVLARSHTQIVDKKGVLFYLNNGPDARQEDYMYAAKFINGNYDILSLHHEVGLFVGTAGKYLIHLLESLIIPVHIHSHLEKVDFCNSAFNYSLKNNIMLRIILNGVYNILSESDYNSISYLHQTEASQLSQKAQSKSRFIVHISELHFPMKVIKYILHTLKNVIQYHPETLCVIGGQYIINNSSISMINNLAVEMKIDKKILFFSNYHTKEQKFFWIKRTDLVVTPFFDLKQVFPETPKMALGQGGVVIKTPDRNAQKSYSADPDYITTLNRNCLLVPFNDADFLAKLIIHLLSDDKVLWQKTHLR